MYAFTSNKRAANKLKPYKAMALPAFIHESKIWAARKTSFDTNADRRYEIVS
jgi:hypothetical protein